MNGISCWTGASPYLQKGFVLFRVHCYISTLSDCGTVWWLITFMFCNFRRHRNLSWFFFFLILLLCCTIYSIKLFFLISFPCDAPLLPLTAPHSLSSILSLNTISSNRIIFWILRCHHAERKNKFNWDTTGVELQQRLWCTWSLYIATLHKCGIPSDVQWIGDGKFIILRMKMSFMVIPGGSSFLSHPWGSKFPLFEPQGC